MGSEKLTPATKPVSKANGIPDGGHSTITTPKETMKKWGDSAKGSIMGKK